ncbi:DUF6221 family protein [Streptomyces sp. NPDC050421]|uniref:DUF6221 family protein n=1 Tax=Streptomyces sp. NPDC050421 TaxID=3365613 RepID=UPI0037B4D1A0
MMTPMDDLVQFLRDRLDDDEQTARAAHVPNWSTDGRRGLHYGVEDGWMADALTTADADHIARHDPARILRDVEAKRRLIDWVLRWPMRPAPPSSVDGVLELLALPYADHEAYRDDWRP